MTVKHEKFEVEVFKKWGRLEAESRQIIFFYYIQRHCLSFYDKDLDKSFLQE